MKAERRKAARSDAADHAAKNFLASVPSAQGAVVGLYHPLKDELGTAPLATALFERGIPLALPAVKERHAPLVFRRYVPGDPLKKGAHGALEPAAHIEELRPSVLVVPLLAFTRRGARLGYGGGYYDRTIAALRAKGPLLAVGYAFGAQEVPSLPGEAHDAELDWVVTEREAIRCAP